MTQDILITPGSGEPQILFRGSGVSDTAIELNVLSSYQSASGSGTALVFEGQEGQLFAVTDNLSSGTIFSVGDITGLSMLSVDASGDVKLGEFANSVIVYPGLTLDDNVPSTTSNVLYNDGGDLMWNGVTVIQSGAAQAVDGSGTASYVARFTDVNTLGTGVIYDNGTNVGIGTASPTQKLDVAGGIGIAGSFIDTRSSNGSFTFSGTTTTRNLNILNQSDKTWITAVGNVGNNLILKAGSNTYQLYLAGDGNVGIDTYTPTQKLDIRYPASGGMALLKSTDTTDGLLFGDMAYSTSNNYQGIKHAAMSGPNDYMIISDGTNTFISAAAGYSTIIGAGGNNLSSQIQLKSTEVVVNENSSNLDFRVESNNDVNALFVDGVTDYVGIGTGSPSEKLHVAGDVLIDGDGGTIAGTTWDNGLLRIGTSSGGISIDTNEIYASHDLYLGALDTASAIIFRHATTERMRVASGGNVGIGTASPSSKLHVQGSSDQLRLSDGTLAFTVGYDNNYLRFKTSAGDTPVVVNWNTGNVGIGSTSPSQKLQVSGNFRLTGAFYDSNNAAGTSGQVLSSTATGTDWISLSEIQGVDGTGSAGQVAFWSDADTITGESNLYWDSSNDRLGIGTSSPLTPLHVKDGGSGSDGIRIDYGPNNTYNLRLDGVGGIRQWRGTGSNAGMTLTTSLTSGSWGGDQGGLIAFSPRDTEAARFDGLGNFGIGTSSPTSTLHVTGDAKVDDIHLDGSTISSLNSSNLTITPAADLNINLGVGDCIVMNGGTRSNSSVNLQMGGSAIGAASFAGGGLLNSIGGNYSSAVGGSSNNISGEGSFVGGGTQNTVDGDYSAVFGRNNDVAAYNYVYILGTGITATQANTTYTQNLISNADVYVSGNVGIGTNAPNATLHVYSAASGDNIFNVEGTNGSLFGVTDNLSGVLMSVNTIAGLPVLEVNSDYSLTAGRFNQNDFVVSSSGNVGIGTASPSEKLDVNGNIHIPAASYIQWGTAGTNTIIKDDSSGNRTYISPRNSMLDILNTAGTNWGTLRTAYITGGGTTSYPLTLRNGGNDSNSEIKLTSTEVVINEGGSNRDFRVESDNDAYALLVDGITDNVGIGTASPSYKLDVQDSSSSMLYLNIGSATQTNYSDLRLATNTGNGQIYKNGTGYTGGGGANSLNIWDQSGPIAFHPNNTANVLYLATNANVGIGTTSPTRRLDLSTGQLGFGSDVTINASQGIYWHSSDDYAIYRTPGTWTNPNYQQLKLRWGTGIVLDPGTGYGRSHVGVVGGVSIGTSYYTTKHIDGLLVQGSAGIGTTSPQQKLHIVGDQRIENATDPKLEFHDGAAVGAYVKFDTSEDNLVLSHVDVAGDNQIALANDGNVGIGTASPNAVLHAYGSTPSGTVFNVEGTNGSLFSVVDNLSGVLMSVNNNAGLPVFEVNDDDSIVGGRFAQNDFVVTTSGDIGMGTANPASKLEVNGAVTATSFSGAGTGLTGTAASLTAGAVTNGVYTTGNQTVGGVKTFSSQIISTAAHNATGGGGQIYLNGTTGNRIDFAGVGYNVPTFTTRSVGTKILLYPALSASSVDYAIGIEASTLWSSIPGTAYQFKWYAGTTSVADLNGAGVLTVAGSTSQINVDNLRLDGNTLSSTNTNGNINIAPNGTGGIAGGSGSTVTCQYSVVSGGRLNCVVEEFSTISGGYNNKIHSLAYRSVISGGSNNNACGSRSVVSGGCLNTSAGSFSVVSGGVNNKACATNSSVSGGCDNFVNARHGSINGGHYNVIQSPTNECCSRGATIGGGIGHNTSGGTVNSTTGDITGTVTCCNAGFFSTIGGGFRNCATGNFSTIAGGVLLIACGTGSAIGGGMCNTASGSYSTVGGGGGFSTSNYAKGCGSTVSGGKGNYADGLLSTVGGGGSTTAGTCQGNLAICDYSTISGGLSNRADGNCSFIGGGAFNVTCSNSSTVSGGSSNCATGNYSTVSGGCNNFVNARHGSINGGHYNVIQSPTNECCSRGATIGGGVGHNTSGGTVNSTTGDITGTVTCCNAGNFSTISGGYRNIATGALSTIGGGGSNNASGLYSTIAGGTGNVVSGNHSVITGGDQNCTVGQGSIINGGERNYISINGLGAVINGGCCNCVTACLATIGGGRENTASGCYSTIGGGGGLSLPAYGIDLPNRAESNRTTIGGGAGNTVSGLYSTIPGGFYGKASRYGEVAHAAGRFAQTGDAQHSTFVARKNTTDATANVELFLDGSAQRMVLTAETTWTFDIKLSAYNDTDNTTAWWIIRGGIRRNAASGTSLIGSLIEERDYEGTMSGTSAAVTADDTNESLKIAVTGLASKNIRWVAVVDVAQVSWGTP